MKINNAVRSIACMVGFVFTSNVFASMSSGQLLQACSAFVEYRKHKPDNLSLEMASDIGECMGFIDGILDGHTFSGLMKYQADIQSGKLKEGNVLLFCKAEKVDKGEIIEMIVKNLITLNTQQLKYPAAMVTISLLAEAFPCQ